MERISYEMVIDAVSNVLYGENGFKWTDGKGPLLKDMKPCVISDLDSLMEYPIGIFKVEEPGSVLDGITVMGIWERYKGKEYLLSKAGLVGIVLIDKVKVDTMRGIGRYCYEVKDIIDHLYW